MITNAKNIPMVNVGIYSLKEFSFVLRGDFLLADTACIYQGEQTAKWVDGGVLFNDKHYESLRFEPVEVDCSFDLLAVTIGVDFHWQRKENQRFKGMLVVLPHDNGLSVINRINIEDYLVSVISSEMSATASKELLKAHAVISRSWLLAQIEKNKQLCKEEKKYQSVFQTEDELIRWYDREDHLLFDVCADDHCQRYQGISRASTPIVQEVITETRAEVLTYNNQLCDARFSKCCGGVTELFETCWEPIKKPYLLAKKDANNSEFPNLNIEENAIQWIRTVPDSFCCTTDKSILNQVLNNYDQETVDFYRWQVSYSQQALSALIKRKSGIDFGDIVDIRPLKRGTSARIEKILLVGSKKQMIIGKELEIRRILSETHLYSSAFIVEKKEMVNNLPGRFVFIGAGWGHGVGLCQIGAAMMSTKGYSYRDILSHYFPGTKVEKRYM